ncbi:uncharacterized protein LOC121387901 [Gigantopelta aegis]|uniref:uncharacterized protein LOC121387901 n=1 Tax=Gigantopelta aegis TaxID=1735272 RepID=UPI001B888FC5|nr:uncharacterized protein LOC121387901 [Gigantopelta aegis]
MQDDRPDSFLDVGDTSNLEFLDEEQLLQWLRNRYAEKIIYGYVGDSLIAVNPCEQLPLYSKQNHDEYTGLSVRSARPPHVFWVADHVHRSLQHTQHQCVVVTGDSGSGKTENTKFILEHLVHLVHTDSQLVHRLSQANSLLEIFGNAATVLNRNSSRFGKLVELEYDSSGGLYSARLECFILEEFRVTCRHAHEKNFHAFYCLFAGLSPHQKHELQLEDDASQYRIVQPASGAEDVYRDQSEYEMYRQQFHHLHAMLQDTGFTAEEMQHLYQVMSAVLHIANVSFDVHEDDDRATIAYDESEEDVARACHVLGLDNWEELAEALVSVQTFAGGEPVTKHKSVRQARDGRDALARELYASLFYGITDRINTKLEEVMDAGKKRSTRQSNNACIRLLDIFGFENLQHNGFEQLFINSTNEKIHQYYLQYTILRERRDYADEGVHIHDVTFKDNSAVLSLIFDKPSGIIPLVDEELSIPKSSDESFLAKCNAYNCKKSAYMTHKQSHGRLLFGIIHYAGEAVYDAEHFLEKNSSTLPNSLRNVVQGSSNTFVHDYFLLGNRSTQSIQRAGRGSMRGSMRRGRATSTPFSANYGPERSTGKLTGKATDHFQNSLRHMMSKLQTAKPVFVRCIKPNMDLKPAHFDSRLVKQQLQSSGLLEVATIRKYGYPIRIQFEEFAKRYSAIVDGRVEGGKDQCKAILHEAGVSEYQLGKSKIKRERLPKWSARSAAEGDQNRRRGDGSEESKKAMEMAGPARMHLQRWNRNRTARTETTGTINRTEMDSERGVKEVGWRTEKGEWRENSEGSQNMQEPGKGVRRKTEDADSLWPKVSETRDRNKTPPKTIVETISPNCTIYYHKSMFCSHLRAFNVTCKSMFCCHLRAFNVTYKSMFCCHLRAFNVTYKSMFCCHLRAFNVTYKSMFCCHLRAFNVTYKSMFCCHLRAFNVTYKSMFCCHLRAFNVTYKSMFCCHLRAFNVTYKSMFCCHLRAFNVTAFNAAVITEREFENDNETEMKFRRFSRCIMYMLIFVLVIASGSASRISLIWLAKSVNQAKGPQVSTMATMLILCQAVPILVSWVSTVIRSMFGRKEWPTLKGLSLICLIDTLQTASRSVLLFKVFPTIHPLQSIVLSLAVCQVPAIMQLLWLFTYNHRDPVFPDVSLVLGRRNDAVEKVERHRHAKRAPGEEGEGKEGEEEEEQPTVYICPTLWHETRQEMVQLLKSLFRLDFELCAKRIAKRKLATDILDIYNAEIHVMFDDAFLTHEDTQQRVVNEYVELLLEVMPGAASSIAKGRIDLKAPDKLITPYGGRLEWEMPGGTKLNVHLKDKEKIKHKKRWSQIMYMYYLLGFKLFRDYETVDDLLNGRSKTDVGRRVKDRKKSKHRVRPFTSMLNNLPRDVVQKADNTFVMCLDGDVDFRPEAVQLLIDRMKKNRKVAAVCGRIHPIGDGPMVWYQQFEYAVGHWLQKAAEHVFGCVLCCPGCFSLFRGSALIDDNIMKMYATEPTEARHYIQYEQGEDRWLCTLLLQQGYKIDYCAGADSYTYAPETFNDFYIQRRRWSPSTLANVVDLIGSWRTTIKMNDNISLLFMIYQFLLLACSVLAPGLVVYMIAGSYNEVLGIDMWQAYLMSVVPVLLYIILCLKAKTQTQVAVAAIMSSVYAIVMVIVVVGQIMKTVEEGTVTTPSVLFMVAMGVVFVTAGLTHPKEILCLPHGILYYFTVPSTFVFLTVFFLCNLHVVTWGTRESPKTANASDLDTSVVSVVKKGRIGKWLESLGLRTVLEDLKTFVRQTLGSRTSASTPNNCITPAGTSTPCQAVVVEELRRPSRPTKQKVFIIKDPKHWAKHLPSQNPDSDDIKDIDDEEKRFWNVIIEEYLKPQKHNKERQDKIKADLISARNNIVFAYFLINLLFTLLILQLQMKENLLRDLFFIAGKYEPFSVVFLSFFSLLVAVQFFGMLAHQWGTFLHLIASTKLRLCVKDDDDQSSLDAIREAKKLQSVMVDDVDMMSPHYDSFDEDEDDDDDRTSGQVSEGLMSTIEEEADYSSDETDNVQTITQYEKMFQQRYRTVRHKLNRAQYQQRRPSISMSREQVENQRRFNVYNRRRNSIRPDGLRLDSFRRGSVSDEITPDYDIV